jgi:hypothetical protein
MLGEKHFSGGGYLSLNFSVENCVRYGLPYAWSELKKWAFWRCDSCVCTLLCLCTIHSRDGQTDIAVTIGQTAKKLAHIDL